MSDREKCNPCQSSRSATPPSPPSGGVPEADASPPRICFFRHTSLLQMPEPWREALRHLGEDLDDMTLESYGLVPEAPNSLATTRARVHALALELATSGRQLEEMAAEPEASQLVGAEVCLCRLAGRLAAQVKEVARRLAAAR